MKIAVVGNGAASIVCVLKLMEASPGASITWYGGKSVLIGSGRTPDISDTPYGVAYGRCGSNHLLNVPAEKMSVYPEGLSFVEFLKNTVDNRDNYEGKFVGRVLYQRYLLWLLKTERIESRVSLERRLYDAGELRDFDVSVLCLGANTNKKNTDEVDAWSYNYQESRLSRLDQPQVLIRGAGLTAMDAAISVWSVNPNAHVTFVSRNGRLPREHDAQGSVHEHSAALVRDVLECNTLRDMTMRIVGHAREDWKLAFNSLRPHWNTLWMRLNAHERRRFLGRLRPFWEIFRHRMSDNTARWLNEHSYSVKKTCLITQEEKKSAALSINATGINTDPYNNDFLAHLIRRGDVKSATSRLGLVGDKNCKVGQNIWCVGAFMRDTFWEATAMHDVLRMADLAVADITKGK